MNEVNMEKLLETKEKHRKRLVVAYEHVVFNECLEHARVFSREELVEAYRQLGVEPTGAEVDNWFDTYGFALQHMIRRVGVPYSLDPATGKVAPLDA
jgi:hypothetical protein